MASNSERVLLETKIIKYRAMARSVPDALTIERIKSLVAELEEKLREMGE